MVDHIEQSALSQQEISKLYREKVGDKHLIYMVDLDTEKGEHIYKYSVIKDIYMEIFPSIAFSFLVFAIILFFISYIYSKTLSNHLYNNIDKLVEYTKKLSYNPETKPIFMETEDTMIAGLGEAFNEMNEKLIEKEKLQQTTLEYISHEMKTPIMIIESYADSAKNGVYPKGNLEESLNTIIKQSKRMENKVNALMKVVKINAAPRKVDKYENVLLGKLIEKVLVDLSGLFKEKKLKLIIDNDISIYADPDKVIILLENLIENQIKYSEKIVSIRIFEKKDEIILLFFNDGEKIDEKIKKDIFKAFIKGPNGVNGLGLSICKTIVNQHNGNIEIKDTKIGSLFKVSLNKTIPKK